ncbi:MAG: helix-turn-helix domain-containing protein [bacterium]|nr:helix-turn-helix domain-containing protein [bacterium]
MPERRGGQESAHETRRPAKRRSGKGNGAQGNPSASGNPTAQTVGSIFRKARESQQLSQAEVAALTRGHSGQISRAMVSLIERGHHLPGLEATVALSRALHVEPLEIFEHVDLPTSLPPDLAGFDADLLDERAQQCFWTGDYRSALTTYDTIIKLLELDPPHDERLGRIKSAQIEIQRAAALRHLGALTAARSAAERAVSLAEDEPEIQARAYIVLASLLEQRGLRPLARDMAERAVELSRTLGPKLQGMAWIEMGVILESWGKFEEARQAYLQAGTLVRQAGDHNHEIHVEGNIGTCLLGLGHREQARRRMVHAVELSRKYNVSASEAYWLVELGKVDIEDNRVEDVRRLAGEAMRIAKPRGHTLTVFRAEWLLHRLARRTGDASGERHRLAHLRRLYANLHAHGGVEEVREYRHTILDSDGHEDGIPGGVR